MSFQKRLRASHVRQSFNFQQIRVTLKIKKKLKICRNLLYTSKNNRQKIKSGIKIFNYFFYFPKMDNTIFDLHLFCSFYFLGNIQHFLRPCDKWGRHEILELGSYNHLAQHRKSSIFVFKITPTYWIWYWRAVEMSPSISPYKYTPAQLFSDLKSE